MRIQVGDYSYGPMQLTRCMTAISCMLNKQVALMSDGSFFRAQIGFGTDFIKNSDIGPWKALCGAVDQLPVGNQKVYLKHNLFSSRKR